jgi:hypothetical protein
LVGSLTGASGASRTAHSIIIPGESYQSDARGYDQMIPICCHSHTEHRGRRDDERDCAAFALTAHFLGLTAVLMANWYETAERALGENAPGDVAGRTRCCASAAFPRVTRSLTRQEIPPPAGRKKPSFFTKHLHYVQMFCEKIKMYHAAAGESGFHLGTCPVCGPTA